MSELLTPEERISLTKELAGLGALLTPQDINSIRCPNKPDTETRSPSYVAVVAIEAVLKAYPYIRAKLLKHRSPELRKRIIGILHQYIIRNLYDVTIDEGFIANQLLLLYPDEEAIRKDENESAGYQRTWHYGLFQ